MRIRLRGINTVRKRLADGTVKTYYYHRASGQRLPGKPGSPEFVAAITEAEKSNMGRHNNTMIGLIRNYLLSPEFAKLSRGTQPEYKRILTKVETEFRDLPLRALDDPRIRRDFLDWRKVVAENSGLREADNGLSIVSSLLTWAIQYGYVHYNHIKGFKRLYRSDRRNAIWTPDNIQRFQQVAPIELNRALMLALETGQRQGDILKLCWSSYDGRSLSIRQEKTGARVEIPCTNVLKSMLDNMEKSSAVILTTKTGRPWKPYHFRHQWKAAALKAGIKDLHFHDLRGTAVLRLAEAGCTVPEIASITGHTFRSVTKILEVYLPRTSALANNAIARLENKTRPNSANQLQTATLKDRSEVDK